MKFFLDTEFNGFRGGLISIAIVPEVTGIGEFYREVEQPAGFLYDLWVAEHVVPHLGSGPSAPIELIRTDVMDFLRHYPKPEIIVDWPSDPWYLFDLLLGREHDPKGFIDFSVGFYRARNSVASRIPHHALEDARANRTSYVLDHIK